jgi:ribosome-associated protein
MTDNNNQQIQQKLHHILEALKEKKGQEIVTINLENSASAFCDYFVICHGTSTTQVDALSNSVNRRLKEKMKETAHHIEGTNNSIWVLMDYSDILVHIFTEEKRSFYNLEDLWADGLLERVVDE